MTTSNDSDMLPVAKNIHVNTKGAVILTEESPEVRQHLTLTASLGPSMVTFVM